MLTYLIEQHICWPYEYVHSTPVTVEDDLDEALAFAEAFYLAKRGEVEDGYQEFSVTVKALPKGRVVFGPVDGQVVHPEVVWSSDDHFLATPTLTVKQTVVTITLGDLLNGESAHTSVVNQPEEFMRFVSPEFVELSAFVESANDDTINADVPDPYGEAELYIAFEHQYYRA